MLRSVWSFGKSLNLSMLRYFFEKSGEDRSSLFEGLAIWQAGEAYRAHYQRYPVLHLTLKDLKYARFDDCWESLRLKLQALFREHLDLLEGGHLDTWEERNYRAVLDGTAEKPLYYRALLDLTGYLHRRHGEKVVVLIDEYDEPIHAGHLGGYGPQIIEVMRAFLGNGLKSNVHLHKAVLTGILRVAKENLFSGLNNLGVYSLLATRFNTCFGFTEAEVVSLLDRAGRAERLPAVRAWYNGYLFGGEVIYNPWSVLSFLHAEDADPEPFWLSTSSNDLIRELLQQNALRLQPAFETLLAGGSVEHVLEENVPLNELAGNDDALWSLFVFSGYLKAERRSRGEMERPTHLLSIPNREVREVYRTSFRRWIEARLRGHGGSLDELCAALLGGDAERFEEQLQAFVTDLLSYHDPGAANPERVYHGFVLGLLAALEPEYQVRSNRESGDGRPDVWIRPVQPGKPGVVLELKVARPRRKTLARALSEGLAQLRKGDYGAELRAAGASVVHAFAVAFDGKKVRVAVTSAAARRTAARSSSRGTPSARR